MRAASDRGYTVGRVCLILLNFFPILLFDNAPILPLTFFTNITDHMHLIGSIKILLLMLIKLSCNS